MTNTEYFHVYMESKIKTNENPRVIDAANRLVCCRRGGGMRGEEGREKWVKKYKLSVISKSEGYNV